MTPQEPRRRGRPRAQPEETSAPVQSVDRALTLLRHLAEAEGLTLTRAAETSGLPLSTVHRLLTTLEHHGLAELDPGGQAWHVGVEAFRIGAAFLGRGKLAERGRRPMQALMEASGETANLAVAEHAAVVFVSQVETHAAIRAFFRAGTRSPFHASGVGKAILSHLPPARALAVLRRAPLERFTARTLTEPAALLAELEAAAARGYAVDDEERHAGMRCVAAAIFNEFGEPVAGLSVSGPTVRVDAAAVERLGPLVRAAAAEVTRAMAGRPPG